MKSSNLLITIKTLILAVLAGFAISLGGWLFLRIENNVLGAFMFSLGLVLIVTFGFYLYTGKIGYLINSTKQNIGQELIKLLLILLGNIIGCIIMGLLLQQVSMPASLAPLVANKLAMGTFPVLITSFFCGLLVYFAVEGFRVINHMFGKYLVLIGCVAGFILGGFEHCIADAFYLALADTYTLDALVFLLIVILGNSLGGLFVPLLNKIIKRCEAKNE